MTKFFDIVCRMGDLRPSAVVLVVTVRAIKHHGDGEDSAALERGMANVRRHLANVAAFGLPCVVGVNRRAGDSDADLEHARSLALEAGAFAAEINDGFSSGGAGAAALAQAVVDEMCIRDSCTTCAVASARSPRPTPRRASRSPPRISAPVER